MSKRAGRDRRSPRHVKIVDAAQVITMTTELERMAALPHAPADYRYVGPMAGNMLHTWRGSSVVLRLDLDFAAALSQSDTSVEMVPDWLSRLPFDALAFSLPVPLSLHDGQNLCHYVGALATGIRSDPSSARAGPGRIWTRYGPLSDGDGARFLWLYTHDGDPMPRGQSVSLFVKGPLAAARTLRDVVEIQELHAREAGRGWNELATLVPLSAQLLLYLTALEPDLEWPAPATIARPQQLRDAQVGHVGWRVGSTLRTWRLEHAANNAAPADPAPSPAGWRLPPHIRRAHWHRVRMATRDEAGHVIGTRTGTPGVDWRYELRWYPPAPVNLKDDDPPVPTVRDVSFPEPGASTG